MYGTMQQRAQQSLDEIAAAGLYKHERRISSAQSAHITANGGDVLNFCANN